MQLYVKARVTRVAFVTFPMAGPVLSLIEIVADHESLTPFTTNPASSAIMVRTRTRIILPSARTEPLFRSCLMANTSSKVEPPRRHRYQNLRPRTEGSSWQKCHRASRIVTIVLLVGYILPKGVGTEEKNSMSRFLLQPPAERIGVASLSQRGDHFPAPGCCQAPLALSEKPEAKW